MKFLQGRIARHIAHSFRMAFLGPQILAFVPALTLGGYWYGGEGLLLFMAILLPATLAMVGVFSPSPRPKGSALAVDPVTHLPLRETLVATLERSFAREPATGMRTAVISIELDEFAELRAQHGDEAADGVLRQVAERIKTVLRQGDLVCRTGSTVFTVALNPSRRVDLESMIQLSARLQAAIAEPVAMEGLRLFLSASVGFCIPRRASEKTAERCLENADIALGDARANGPGAIRAYSAQPRRRRMPSDGLSVEVTGALETGQIRPWFQPQICCDTGRVSGVEALARWEHPDRGIILPGAFLPAVAAAGLNCRMGEIVLFHTLSALRGWDEAGLDVPNVSVNFCSEELSDPTLCDRIRWELDRFEMDPERLTIEVLETVIAHSPDDTITRNIARLADFGCGVDLDDFGTGHTSISNIRRFSVSRIKIDRSFIARVDTDRDQQQMLTAILEMAERLGIETLAEGVETVGEHALLAQLGCGHVQGYSVARPMPGEELEGWLTEHRERLRNNPVVLRSTG